MGDIIEFGLTELIDKDDDEVAQNEFSKSVGINLPNSRPRNGVIRSIGFYVNGAGQALSPDGDLLILDVDPEVSAGDTNLTEAKINSVLGIQSLLNTDLIEDAAPNGSVALYHDLFIPFHLLDTLYLVYKATSATAWNSAGGDDEELKVNLWAELRN